MAVSDASVGITFLRLGLPAAAPDNSKVGLYLHELVAGQQFPEYF